MVCLLRENILRFDRPVPRYTSYPTAPHFEKTDDDVVYSEWLSAIPAGTNLSLYLHVPFCPKLCWYCGCNTKITQRYAPVENYLHLMMREIEMVADKLPSDYTVSHIHLGGGSPGMMRAGDFMKLMDRIRTQFHLAMDCDIAIELDPREVTEARIAVYAKNGVNRVSLGVQDFDDSVLAAINRQQPFHLTYNAVQLCREYGIDNINFDLLYGLPKQTTETMRQAIDKALLLGPDRLALFGYAHVPWMKKHMRLIDESTLPDKDLRFDLFNMASTLLQDSGYQAIGIDHFAKTDDPLAQAALNGRLKRNFQGYTVDDGDLLIGLGASSIGYLPAGYAQNHVDMPHYKDKLLSGQLPISKLCVVTDEDRLRKHVIDSLMCNLTVNVNESCDLFGYDPHHFDKEILSLTPYIEAGFATVTSDGTITVKQDARTAVRLVCSAFDNYLPMHQNQPRHSRAV